ncbi:sodium-dependent phosphate transport protein 2A-like isoform X2 [Apostichopus japonicus]|uniref:sodium-dependent phosphate transport protein 2A-like isoform X2 n=1 Tax=Stichopus japonicus TaxID=307972 RepID=UPI003AB7E378
MHISEINMYPEDDRDPISSLENSFVYTPNETPPNEEAQCGQHLLDHSPRNAISTPPNLDSGVWGKASPVNEKKYFIHKSDVLPSVSPLMPSEPKNVYIAVPVMDVNGTSPQPALDENDSTNTSEDDFWALTETDNQFGPKWSELDCKAKIKRVCVDWLLRPICIITLLYFFVCSLDLMSSSFRLLGGREAGQVLSENELLNNPICGLMLGILVTVLVQSSSTSTSIVVSIVSAGLLQVDQAIFIIMGANIGTSVTNTIVALSQAGNRNEFRRAFGSATIHDMFNWLAVIVLLPMEVLTGYLYRMTSLIVNSFSIESNENAKFDLLKKLTKPTTSLVIQLDKKVINKIAVGEVDKTESSLLKMWCKKEEQHLIVDNDKPWNSTEFATEGPVVTEIVEVGVERCHYLLANTGLPEGAIGAILLVVSLVLLCICLIFMVKLLHSLMKGRMAGVIKKTINADFPGIFRHLTGYFAIGVGAVITFMVQSSSVFTSTVTPLVGMGVITLERVYPLTLGANIGTTATGMLAALASSGDSFEKGIQIALCHFCFNVSGILIWYPIPFLRKVPLHMAKTLGNTTAKYRWFAILYILVMFFFLPGIVFGLSLISIWCLAAVGLPAIAIFIFVIIVNILQTKKPHWLPKKLLNWDFLPKFMHSLAPLDRIITKFGPKQCCCIKTKKNDLSIDVETQANLVPAPRKLYTEIHTETLHSQAPENGIYAPGKESCV